MPQLTDTVVTAGGSCAVALFTPEGPGPWPGVVVYPDAGGMRDTFEQMAATLAGFGYAVLLPDVYYRHGNWAPFDMGTAFGDAGERQRLMSMIASITPQMIVDDAAAFFDYLTGRDEVRGDRFGTTGYCMGGRMSLVVAGRLPEKVAAAAAFHAGKLVTEQPDSPHLLADKIGGAVYIAGADNDGSFTPQQAETLDRSLSDAGVEHTVEIYPAEHGFAVPDNPPYDAAAAERHWAATRDFFAASLPS